MKNIFIFLEGELGIKIMIIKLFIIITIFFPNNLYALTGKEINIYTKKWLASQGIKSNPQFSPNKKLPDCNQNIIFEKHFDNYKLIKVTCRGEKPWTISVKTNSNIIQSEKINVSKFNKILVLNKSIEKGNYIKKK